MAANSPHWQERLGQAASPLWSWATVGEYGGGLFEGSSEPVVGGDLTFGDGTRTAR